MSLHMFWHICLSPEYSEQWANVKWTGMRRTSGWVESTVNGTGGICPSHVSNSPHMQIPEYPTEEKECQQDSVFMDYCQVITSLSQLISSLISYRQIIEVCGLVQLVDSIWLMEKVKCFRRGCLFSYIVQYVRSNWVARSSEWKQANWLSLLFSIMYLELCSVIFI